MLPTYQKEGENESLLIPQQVSMEQETPAGFWTKTNKTRAGVVMVVGMIVAAFAVRSELHSPKAVVTVDGIMQSSSPLMGSSPVYVEPTSTGVLDTENVMIAGNPLPGVVTQHPESEETTGIMTSGSDLSGINTGATLIQKVAAASSSSSSVTATTEEVATTATTTTTTPTTTIGVDPHAPIPKTIVLGDPNHPAPAKSVPTVTIPTTEAADTTKPVNDIANIKSDTRLSPLFMSSHTETNGMLRTFFSKYGFVGNRLTDKEKYHIPTAVLTADVKGDAAIWAYATMTSGTSTL